MMEEVAEPSEIAFKLQNPPNRKDSQKLQRRQRINLGEMQSK